MQQKLSRVPWIDYLRGFITLLVVAHHSSLAYTSFASFNKAAYILSTHPVVDSARWKGLDVFEDFNDIFFMSLMFLISGIFVMRSIGHKGRRAFVRDRFRRLFIPFIVAVTALMLLAYYPAWLLAHGAHGIHGAMGRNDPGAYIVDFFTVEAWPVGPPWFIWVLFAFNLVFAGLYPYVAETLTRWGTSLAKLRTPLEIVLLGYIITWLLYIPMMMWAGPYAWTGVGPFDFQVSRILLYFGYFVLGILIGSPASQQGIFAEGSVFVEKWRSWLIGCLAVYALLKLSEAPLEWMVRRQLVREHAAHCIYRSAWCLSCVLSCMAFLTLFKKGLPRIRSWWDSLSANAYGIYLVHYIFVTWCQYFLLGLELPALTKFLITFIVSAAASWGVTAAIRMIPPIRKYL